MERVIIQYYYEASFMGSLMVVHVYKILVILHTYFIPTEHGKEYY